jgi:Protein of unknown function (DUF3667)
VSDAISGLGGLLADGAMAVAVAGPADDGLKSSALHQEGQCYNCRAPLSGPFCHACGQKAGHLHRPIWELGHDFMHSILHWDGRIWFTLRAMLLSPARHVNDWINGRQMRYVPPIRLFVFISLLMIGLLTFSDIVLWQLQKVPLTEKEMQANYEAQDKQLLCLLGSVSLDPNEEVPCEKFTVFSIKYRGQFLGLQSKNSGLRNDLIDTTDIKTEGSNDVTKARGVIAHFNDMLKRPKEFNAAVSGSLSKYFLIAVPLHALLLKIFYIRRKRYLMEHVIFSLQSHTVLFLLLLVCMIVAWIGRGFVNGNHLIGGMFLVYAIHLFVAMKKFYGQGAIRTSLKYMMVGFCYFTFITTIGALLLVRSMGGLDKGSMSISVGG